MNDPDLARIFENAFPNTLDTTVSWHVNGQEPKEAPKRMPLHVGQPGAAAKMRTSGPHSFIVTGDITAEWLRDSTNQLQAYHALASKDAALRTLIQGAIATQAEYVTAAPYCNAFQPPPASGLHKSPNGVNDAVHPQFNPETVFECKYELDSLAHFLKLGNEFYKHTKSTDFVTDRWLEAVDTLMDVVSEQSKPTFNKDTGQFERNQYTFQRETRAGTETLNLGGIGNPMANDTGLVRSAFRPSDDATILPFLIPANAMMAVELGRAADILKSKHAELSSKLRARAETIRKGIEEHAIVRHPHFGDVYAFEVDGYGSHLLMDDANVPSLLSLPMLGFVSATDPVYMNTRRMILSQAGNPYYLTGPAISGIGGPHVGLQNAWPMSLLVQALTSDDDDEIRRCLSTVKKVSRLGLVHETVRVTSAWSYTRAWFAWANSVFAQSILDLARRKPELVFGDGAAAYRVEDVRVVT